VRSGVVEMKVAIQPDGRYVRSTGATSWRLDELDRELDGVRHETLVDQLQRFLGQVVLLVGEVEDAQRRDTGLHEREMVVPASLAELRDDVVALRKPEPLDGGCARSSRARGAHRS